VTRDELYTHIGNRLINTLWFLRVGRPLNAAYVGAGSYLVNMMNPLSPYGVELMREANLSGAAAGRRQAIISVPKAWLVALETPAAAVQAPCGAHLYRIARAGLPTHEIAADTRGKAHAAFLRLTKEAGYKLVWTDAVSIRKIA